MSNAFPVDPFTQVYQAVRAGLLAGCPAVKAGNFQDMSAAGFEEWKGTLDAASAPEFVLLNGAFRLLPFGTNSRTADATQTFSLIATHDALRLTPLNALKFQVLIALLKLDDTLGLPFVRGWAVTGGGDDPFGQPEWKRGTLRWVSACTISVDLYFDRRLLLAM